MPGRQSRESLYRYSRPHDRDFVYSIYNTLRYLHIPPVHICLPGHIVPHDPQLRGSVARFVSQPFQIFWSQSPQPLKQIRVQRPPKHAASAWGGDGQATPHSPQLRISVFTSTQSGPHLTCPDGHVSWPHTVSGDSIRGNERIENNKKSLQRVRDLPLNIFCPPFLDEIIFPGFGV